MTVEYKTYWSDEIPNQAIEDFLQVENAVLYHGNCTIEFFNRKFLQNIYGPSLILLAYIEGKPVGTHVAWRNDIGTRKAYQGTDSCVLPEYEGLMIFPEMLMLVKKKLGKENPVYGFPNPNSFPIAMKMKHQLVATCRQAWYLTPLAYKREEPIKIPFLYAQWWLKKSSSDFFSLKYFGHYYIVCFSYKRLGICVLNIVGEVEKETAAIFPKYRGGLFLLSYKSANPRWYNKNRISGYHITNSGAPVMHVPTWTIDAI